MQERKWMKMEQMKKHHRETEVEERKKERKKERERIMQVFLSLSNGGGQVKNGEYVRQTKQLLEWEHFW